MADIDPVNIFVVSAIADAVAARLRRPAQRWLTATEAAAYLKCPVSRIRKLTMIGGLPVHRDGRRVLYDVSELDEYVLRGGAKSP
jgi:excisionase family DNA binding protein